MKFRTVLSTALIAVLASTNAFASINLKINEKLLTTDAAPIIIEGRTLVPVRAIFEELGATVEWDDTTKTVTAIADSTSIQLVLNSANATVNGETKTLDVPAQIVDGRTMVPARFVAENLNCTVNWNANTQTVEILNDTNSKITTQQNQDEKEQAGNNTSPQSEVHKVYITKTGSKYHYDNNCNGATYYESTLEEAEKKGLEPCEKCVK